MASANRIGWTMTPPAMAEETRAVLHYLRPRLAEPRTATATEAATRVAIYRLIHSALLAYPSAGGSEHARQAEQLSLAYEQATNEAHMLFRENAGDAQNMLQEAKERFTDMVTAVKQMAGEMQRELESTLLLFPHVDFSSCRAYRKLSQTAGAAGSAEPAPCRSRACARAGSCSYQANDFTPQRAWLSGIY